MLDALPRSEMRERIDGHEATIAIAFPQLEVQTLEGFWIAGADVADRVARADVLRAWTIEIGADRDDGLEVRVVRRPAVAVVDDETEAVPEPTGERDLAVVDR